jgi:hypothetical protein
MAGILAGADAVAGNDAAAAAPADTLAAGFSPFSLGAGSTCRAAGAVAAGLA